MLKRAVVLVGGPVVAVPRWSRATLLVAGLSEAGRC
jgi:hypothetical protein